MERATLVGTGDSVTGAGSNAGSGPKALDPGGADNPVTEAPPPPDPAGHQPRALKSSTKEPTIGFRPRPGTRARLKKRAGGRALSHVLEAAVDAYLGRKVTEVDHELRAALTAELAPIGRHLSGIRAQATGVGRNLNQMARFVNGYKRLPLAYREDLDTIRAGLDAILAELTAIREALDALAGKPRP